MLDGRDADAADRWVDDWLAGIEERAAQAKDLSERLAQLTGSARSDDGLIEVSVGSSGTVTDLRLDEDIRRQPAARTAREILAAMRTAQAALAEQMSAAVAETVGAETEVGRAVVASFPSRPADSGRGADV
jgi:DNA-binding protein YbaB